MAIIRMQKVAVVGRRSNKEALLDRLQELGVLEIREVQDVEVAKHMELDFQAAELDFALKTLEDVASAKTIAAMRKPMSPEEIMSAVRRTDIRSIIDALHRMEAEDTAAERTIGELRAEIAVLSPWKKLSIRLDAQMETEKTVSLLGTLPAAQADACEQMLRTELPRALIERLDEREGVFYCTAVVWKKDRSRFEELVTRFGWTSVYLPSLPGLPAALYEEKQKEERRLLDAKARNMEERRRLSVELPSLVRVRQYMRWLDAKQSARDASREGYLTVSLQGWMPASDIAKVELELKKVSSAVAILPLEPNEGEEPPILLRNSRLIKPFESVTTLYGLPLSSDMDPTPLLAPFFALYFAICLTDAGYGLALALIFGAYLLISRKTVEEARLPWLLFYSGIVSIIVGILFGGWFGLTPAQVPAFLTRETSEGRLFIGQLWNLSAESGIQFLQYLSLALGITHIFFGIFLAGWHKWVHGQRASAFWEHFTSHILLGAVIFYFVAPATLQAVAQYVLYAAIAVMVWGKGYGSAWYLRPVLGIIGFLNFLIGLLSNSLSYLRLLALGLVTGAIALAVNQVAIEMGRLFPPFLGIPVMILIALGGHLVSIALNALGSFIHSGRLQFIEFFSQFFEGGGRPFSPLRRTTSSS